jgi:hypothetical protein
LKPSDHSSTALLTLSSLPNIKPEQTTSAASKSKIHNALVELEVLREKLDEPYIANGEEPPRDLLRDWEKI